MKLSDAYNKYTREGTYAICTKCKKAWIDDIPVVGIGLNCPTGDGFALLRGVTDPSINGCTIDDGSDLTSHKEEDPGRQARNTSQVKSKI